MTTMNRFLATFLGLTTICVGALAQPLKLPVDSSEKGTVYVTPNLSSTETSANTNGATVGVERPDGAGAYGGVDTSAPRRTYSAGASSGGSTSFSAGVQSDGKTNNGVKAGVTLKY